MTRGAETAAAQTTTYGYSGAQLTSITTAANRTWAIGYDAAGRVSGVTSPASGTAGQPGYTPAYTTQYSYSPGRTVVVEGAGTSAAVAMTYTLDAAGEVTSVTDGLGNTSHSAYDADHDVTTSTDANNNTTTNKYQYIGPNGAVGQVVEEDQPAIQPYVPGNGATVTTSYVYDPDGDRLATISANGAVATTTYDALGRPVGATGPAVPLWYDQDGNIAQTVHLNGDVVYDAYDAADRLANVEIDAAPISKSGAATHAKYESYGYDATGNVTVFADSDNRTAIARYSAMAAYDPEGRITSISENAGGSGPYTSQYTYNANDLRQMSTYPGGVRETAGYDPNNELTSLVASGPNMGSITTTLNTTYGYGYNAAGGQRRTFTRCVRRNIWS